MNGIHGKSIWTLMPNGIVHTDILNGNIHSVLVLSSAVIFYTLAGTKFDLLCTTALFVYLNHFLLTICTRVTIQCTSEIFPYLGFGLATYFVFASQRSGQSPSSWQGPGQPYLIPCRTTHRRFFPQKHSFSYSYLTVGIPVGYKGSANGMIEINERSSSLIARMIPLLIPFQQSWYCIQSSDHLERGYNELSLRGKLNRFLQSEGVDPIDFPYAYLITAARFAGYNFNPVSLWYLYSPDKILSAIVLEVNNTYDERRPYLVLRGFSAESRETKPVAPYRITGSRVKDFHVSPFSSRKGCYSVRANDPLGPGMNGCRGINITITLNSSKGHPKLVARLFSEVQAINPIALGPVSKIIFLATWFWVGFATVPRIVKQGMLLLYRRKLHMWDTPVPLMRTLGRHQNSIERTLENSFRKYLEFLVCDCKKPLLLKYSTTGFPSSTEATWASSHGQGSHDVDILELRVLTPAFYTRFIQYVDNLDAMIAELNESRTIWVNNPARLADLFTNTSMESFPTKFVDFWFAGAVNYMRQRPPKLPLASISADKPCTVILKVNLGDICLLSSMDCYFISHQDRRIKREYQWATIRQLIADRYFLGYVGFLNQVMNLVRICIAMACASSLLQITRGRA